MVRTIRTEDRDWGYSVRRRIGDETIHFTGYDRTTIKIRAEIAERLYERCGNVERCKNGTLPTAVACEGKAAIAAYLYSMQLESVESIADQLDVAASTVEQYLIDFRRNRR